MLLESFSRSSPLSGAAPTAASIDVGARAGEDNTQADNELLESAFEGSSLQLSALATAQGSEAIYRERQNQSGGGGGGGGEELTLE